jgi:diguanylate cyclase
MYAGSYDELFVLLSFLIAVLASYTALDMAGRISSARGRTAYGWLAVGAFAMGVGIWSMHFVGMLAFVLPIPLGYDPVITLLSLLIAIASSALALWLGSQPELPWSRLVCGAILMGAGIVGMHYTGMSAMHMVPAIRYTMSWFAISIGIAVLASGSALWITFRLRLQSRQVERMRTGGAVVMGCAIVGMHYAGMAAAQFPIGSICGAAYSGAHMGWVAPSVIVGTVAIMVIALAFSVFDLRFQVRTNALAASLAKAQELTYFATHDNLSGLPNRVLLEQRLASAMRDADRDNKQIAVMFVDLDGFKAVNDALGHHVGDLLLIQVGQRMREVLRDEDMVARIGGDEFVLVLEIDEPGDARSAAEMIVGSLGGSFELEGRELRVSASVGIAIYPGSGEHPHDLLTSADAAMYRAKSLGKNGYCFYDISLKTNARAQLQLAQDLRQSLERHELLLHYQPKFDASGRTMVGVEALLRWAHPTRGLILPDQFIALAEKIGLIVSIGEWVIHEACRQTAQWREAGHAGWTTAINLSAVQFRYSRLPETIRVVLERYALPAECLVLEVTESTAMADVEASAGVLERLREMGVQLAIDDFGTGYSSLLNLKRLPVHELKIDRDFVRELASSAADAAIVGAIVELGKTLNLRIVAEGVETAEQQAFLARAGCHSMQGFLLGRPMPASQLIEEMGRYRFHRVDEEREDMASAGR